MQALIAPPEPPQPMAELVPGASQWTLIRRRFLKHRLAAASTVVVALLYLVVVFADFLAYSDPAATNPGRPLVPPQPIHFFEDGHFAPHVHALHRWRDPQTFEMRYTPDPATRIPVVLWAEGYRYRILGFEAHRHLIGVAGRPATEGALFIMGADSLGRDLFSRILLAIRTSLVIGLAAVALSLSLGLLMGTISGYYGGLVDLLIQRLIEILRAIPTIPLWMGLAAAIPASWSITAVYFTVTLIIALIGWTELARELRGRIMALRNEDYVLAAELAGSGPGRIMLVHLLPACTSHIIATTTLAIPAMIASETALGFLGLGLRPPAISLGVLLNGAQNLEALALSPWLLWPVAPTAAAILAFNFIGDGLRDAADPYA
ncbi:MAG TPA: ABC transporter permease [Phenylobacterium sp.]|uniref:ABC transporter permease n=1 Tax=Phenylobacterium sp. TaxID=1871053 RepID=UPI002B6F581A|nr:ABC transporter permease [Phenylobacterium sp.]HXA37480.1 ABC transporter permease [Phenylobacterium sp.]